MGCALAGYWLYMHWEELLIKSMSRFGENDQFETPVKETLQTQMSKEGDQTFADPIREQAKEIMEVTGNAEIMQSFGRRM